MRAKEFVVHMNRKYFTSKTYILVEESVASRTVCFLYPYRRKNTFQDCLIDDVPTRSS